MSSPYTTSPNGEPLDPSITPADIAAAGGGAGGARFGLQDAGDARAEALYLADSWQMTDRFRLDLGVRYEELTLDFVHDTGPGFADGTIDLTTHLEGDEVAYTGAVNFDLTDELGFFVRYSEGFLWPHFDDIRDEPQHGRRGEAARGRRQVRRRVAEPLCDGVLQRERRVRLDRGRGTAAYGVRRPRRTASRSMALFASASCWCP